MPTLRYLLVHAARRLAADPRVRAKAAAVFDKELKPRAQAAWRQAQPRLHAARNEMRAIAAETNPRDNPREFVRKVKQRLFDHPKRP